MNDGHSGRVAPLSLALGTALGIMDHDLAVLAQAAGLHDAGKSLLPYDVLQKPGPLNEGEWALMRRHPLLGARMLEAGRAHRACVRTALAHHENYDGSGYPFGLRSSDIPIFARIVALTDTYDALRSHRPYKPAYSHRHSMRLIQKARTVRFDPVVVDAFTWLMN